MENRRSFENSRFSERLFNKIENKNNQILKTRRNSLNSIKENIIKNENMILNEISNENKEQKSKRSSLMAKYSATTMSKVIKVELKEDLKCDACDSNNEDILKLKSSILKCKRLHKLNKLNEYNKLISFIFDNNSFLYITKYYDENENQYTHELYINRKSNNSNQFKMELLDACDDLIAFDVNKSKNSLVLLVDQFDKSIMLKFICFLKDNDSEENKGIKCEFKTAKLDGLDANEKRKYSVFIDNSNIFVFISSEKDFCTKKYDLKLNLIESNVSYNNKEMFKDIIKFNKSLVLIDNSNNVINTISLSCEDNVKLVLDKEYLTKLFRENEPGVNLFYTDAKDRLYVLNKVTKSINVHCLAKKKHLFQIKLDFPSDDNKSDNTNDDDGDDDGDQKDSGEHDRFKYDFIRFFIDDQYQNVYIYDSFNNFYVYCN